eukprot:COSAG02_NODE_558_length_20348_cov_6.479431_15_plen_84_part_00
MPEQPGALSAQLLNVQEPVYPENIPGSAQAQAVRNNGRTLRAGDSTTWCLLGLVVCGVAALGLAILFPQDHVHSSLSSSSGSS